MKLIIIRGNSGSGKTTVAKSVRLKMPGKTMLISQDVIRREILKTKDTDGNPAIQLIQEMALYGKRSGFDVIIEGILVSQKYGTMLKELMREFEDVSVYYVDVSFEETVRRHAGRHNAHEFGEVEMREWYSEKDVLGTPGEVVLVESTTEDEAVNAILAA